MTDLFFSELAYAPGSGFGAFFTAVGECPALFPAVYAAVYAVLLLFRRRNTDKDRRKKAVTFFVYMLFAVAVTAAVVMIFKHLWGRVRFSDLDADKAGFTPWYLPRGFTGAESFPSGHAAMSALSFFVSDGIEYFTGKRYRFADVLCSAFVVMVCAARLTEGAHYVSDLAAGVFIALTARSILLRLTGIRSGKKKKSGKTFDDKLLLRTAGSELTASE